MKFLVLTVLALFAVSAFAAADNITTRSSYPQPRMLDNTSRVYPVVVAKTTDEVGNVISLGPITQNSWYYASPIASPITDTAAHALVAGVSGKVQYVSGFSASNTSATGSIVTIKDGTTVMYSGYLAATSGQLAVQFNPPLKASASASVNFVINSTGTSTHVSAQGFVR